MKIDLYDKLSPEVYKYLRDDDKAKLIKAAEDVFGAFEGLSIGGMGECMAGDFSCVFGRFRDTWAQALWMEGFPSKLEQYTKTLVALSPKMDAEEEQAASGLMESTLIESLLVFARSYFGLHSFKDAERITLGEVLIAKKAVYNEVTFRKKLSSIQIAKAKRKKI